MKHKPPPILILLVLIIIFSSLGYWYFSNNPTEWEKLILNLGLITDQETDTRLIASGFIEANELTISAEIPGRIKTLLLDQGDPVTVGEDVIYLDTALLDAQTEQINAQIALAQTQLAQLEADIPQEKVMMAEAAIALANTQQKAAYQAWQDTILLRDNPQQLNAQIDAAYNQLAVIQLQIDQSALIRDALELRESIAADYWNLTQQGIDFSMILPTGSKFSKHIDFPEGDKQQASVQWNLATMSVWQGWVNWENANTAYKSMQNKYYTLLTLKENPHQADLQVVQAEANYHTKAAAVPVAQANLNRLNAGIPQTQIDILKAQVEQAQSQLITLAAQREKYIINSPISGLIIETVAHQGEVAVPGNTLLTVANLDKVTLTVYVSTIDYARLNQNQQVEVYVDSYPDQAFKGSITHISDEAEFTPKNVQTKEERVSLVYAIKITVPNPNGQLKPGMPADAVFIEALDIEH